MGCLSDYRADVRVSDKIFKQLSDIYLKNKIPPDLYWAISTGLIRTVRLSLRICLSWTSGAVRLNGLIEELTPKI